MMKKQKYTISVFTENVVGILNRVSIIFTGRKINVESITASESEIKGIYRYTIVITETENQIKKVIGQLEKQVEVVKAIFHPDAEIVHQEIALYKVKTGVLASGGNAEKIVRSHNARVLSVEAEFTVLEKTGHKEETQQLFDDLEPFGILEFVRSGRVAVTKPMKTLSSIVEQLEQLVKN